MQTKPTPFNFEAIEKLVSSKASESQNLEFKREIPFDPKNGTKYDGTSKIPSYGITKICKEVVGFLNSNGGRLFIGIDEEPGDDQVGRASSINLIPNVAATSAKLHQAISDAIEPKIIGLKVIPIFADSSQDRGVIYCEVPASDTPPHRNKDKDFYIRNDHRTERLTVSEALRLYSKSKRQNHEGCYTVRFSVPGGEMNGGFVFLDKNKIYGGDSQFLYTGTFDIDITGKFIGFLKSRHYQGNAYTAYNTFERDFNAVLTGQIHNDSIRGEASRENGTVSFFLQKFSNLS